MWGDNNSNERLLIGVIIWNVRLERSNKISKNSVTNISACLFHIKDDLLWWTSTVMKGTDNGHIKCIFKKYPKRRFGTEPQHRLRCLYNRGDGVTGPRNYRGVTGRTTKVGILHHPSSQ